MPTIYDLQTPCLVLDQLRLQRNADRLTQRYAGTGVRLRPHLKTAKSIDVARIVTEGNFGGITVSTLKEAEYFAEHGVTDILYAVGIVPQKALRAAALARAGVTLGLICDDVETIREVGEIAAREGVVFDVYVEVDSGEKRAGLLPGSELVVPLGRQIHEQAGTRLAGVLTHAGNSYLARSIPEVESYAEAERLAAVTVAEQLRAAGLPCPTVSVGSTPTAVHGRSFKGLTEMRCGVYMFGDVFQSEIGSHGLEDMAVTVLATVVGHRKDLNSALIDAGGLALSKDRSTGAPGLPRDVGFGLIYEAQSCAPIEDIWIGHVYQEHGLLTSKGPFPFDKLPIGTKVRALPNHICMTAAMYDGYHVVANVEDPQITDYWLRTNGW